MYEKKNEIALINLLIDKQKKLFDARNYLLCSKNRCEILTLLIFNIWKINLYIGINHRGRESLQKNLELL